MASRFASRGLCSAVSLFALMLPAAPALAQTSDQPAVENSGQIEEVVVTATRRSEALSKVPESISAFTTEKMDQLNVKSFADLVHFTPGVTFDEASKNISIRGVNSDAGDATTGIYIDDTPIQLRELGFGSDNTLPAVFDLERVEVLRGPQGTLFGAGSEGGTVRYITPQPSLTDYGVYAKSEISTTQDGAPSYEGGVAVGGPIVDDQLGFRISAWGRRDGGWIDKVDVSSGAKLQSDTNFVDTYVARAALTWQPFHALVVTPSVFYQNRDQNNLDDYWVGLSDPDRGIYKTATPENMADKDHWVLPALKADYDFGGVELISNTSYFDRHELVQDYSGTLYDLSYFQQSTTTYDPTQQAASLPGNPYGTYLDPAYLPCPGGLCAQYTAEKHADPNFVPPPLLTPDGINLPGFGPYKAVNNVTNEQKNFTQEVRLQSTDTDSALTWILGVFYTQQSQLSVEEINDPQLPALTQYLWGESMLDLWGENLLPNGDDYINHTFAHERQLAGFVNATYAITDKLKIQAGARIAQTHFDFVNFSDGAQNFGPLSVPGGKKNETPFTPMGDITYQINDDDLVYFTVAKGYRIGGANPLFPIDACTEITSEPTSYDSDSVVSYEFGSKDKFLGGRLETSGSVYYLKWNNIQQSITLPSCAFRYTVNQGAAEAKGFDLQGEWLVTDALDVDFSVGYIDASYTKTSESAGLVLAENGDRLPGSPWTVSLGTQYSATVMGLESFVRVDYEFASEETGLTPERDMNTTLFDKHLRVDPPTHMLSLRAGTTIRSINFALFMDNVLDANPRLDLNHQDSDTALYEATTLRPRTIGLTAIYRY